MEEEKIREKIAEKLYWQYMGYDSKWHPSDLAHAPISMRIEMLERATQILSLDGIRIEAGNQDLPENSEPNPPDDREEIIAYQAYNSAQQDMLKAGFVKCRKNEERQVPYYASDEWKGEYTESREKEEE